MINSEMRIFSIEIKKLEILGTLVCDKKRLLKNTISYILKQNEFCVTNSLNSRTTQGFI